MRNGSDEYEEKIKKLEAEVKSLKGKIEIMEKRQELWCEYIRDDIKHLYRLCGL